MRLLRLKKLNRRELNRQLDDHKTARRRQSLMLLSNPGDALAEVEERQLTNRIRELKQVKEGLPHPQHKFLVVSSSRHGPMLYAFCRGSSCRHRVFKSYKVTVRGSSIKDWFLAGQDGCAHPSVSLKRAKHFDISATCLNCGQSYLVRNMFVKSSEVLWPKIDWTTLGRLGDSMLPKGDPRLISSRGQIHTPLRARILRRDSGTRLI